MGASIGQAGAAGSGRGPLAPLRLSLAVDPTALAGARRALGDWLGDAGVRRRDIDDVLIAANEACMNAVEHSGTPPEHGIRLLAREQDGRLLVEVRDSGRWQEPTERTDRGHGLTLMGELTDVLAIDREGRGTTVVMEKALTFGEAASATAAQPPRVSTERVEGTCVARLRGEVDLASVERIEAAIDAATGAEPAALVVDVSGVSYLDSAGVHMLYRLGHRRRAAGAAICIVAPRQGVRRVLELTNIEATIPLAETLEAAIAVLAR